MPYPKVGVALGSGAARGLANLGVLQVLQEQQIPVEVVCGTSAGAIAAGLFAAGSDLRLVGKMVLQLDWSDLTSWTLRPQGLVAPDKIHDMLRLLTRNQDFEDLPIKRRGSDRSPYRRRSCPGLWFGGRWHHRQHVDPGIFVPVPKDGMLLVDGALVNRVPGNLCRRLERILSSRLMWDGGPARKYAICPM